MEPISSMPVETAVPRPAVIPILQRYYYSGAAAFLLVLMFIGFQQFYLHGRAYPDRVLTPPIRTLLIFHGITMTAWMLLFVVQPLLIARANRRLHMRLGKLGGLLAATIVITGLYVGIQSGRVNPPDVRLWELSPQQFMAVPLFSILIFGGFVALGIWQRRRPEIHRPAMLLAVLAAMPAALDRIDALKLLYSGTIWGTVFGPFFSTLVIGLILLAFHWTLTRRLNRTFAVGYLGLVITGALIMQLAHTPAWAGFARFLTGT